MSQRRLFCRLDRSGFIEMACPWGELEVLLVDEGGESCDITGSASGSWVWRANEPGSVSVEWDECGCSMPVDPWGTLIEARLGGETAWRGVVTESGGGRLEGFTPSVWAGKRLVGSGREWTEWVSLVWSDLWAGVNSAGTVVDVPAPQWTGPTVNYRFGVADRWSDVLGAVGAFVAWSEHGAAIYDSLLGAPEPGPDIGADWFLEGDCLSPVQEGGLRVTQVRVLYGPDLGSFVDLPPLPRSDLPVLQTVVEYPEILTEPDAAAVGEEILAHFSWPRLSLPAGALNLEVVDWRDLIPTSQHRSLLEATRGENFELGDVEVGFVGGCVTGADADWTQPGLALLADRIPRPD